MRNWLKRNWFAVGALVVLMTLAGIAQRIQSVQAAAAQATEADFNGRQMPVDMVGPHTWWAAQTFSGGTVSTPAAKTANFTFSAADNTYIIDTSGGAITATLPAPSTMPTGKTWKATLKTAGAAVTFSAAPFSVNGAVTDANMDAAGDSFEIMNTGAGYVFTSRYIH